MSGDDAAPGLRDVQLCPRWGRLWLGGGFYGFRDVLDHGLGRLGFLHRRLHLRGDRATGRVRQDPALGDRADVEAPVCRDRCDARGEIAALLHLAIEGSDPAVERR